MLTELEEEYGIDDVVQDKPEMSDEQRAVYWLQTARDWFSCPYLDQRGGDWDTGQQRRERDERVLQRRGSAREDQARPNG